MALVVFENIAVQVYIFIFSSSVDKIPVCIDFSVFSFSIYLIKRFCQKSFKKEYSDLRCLDSIRASYVGAI